MQQDQDIKGFTIFELLVVLAMIGIVSAVGIPNFTKWKKDRELRTGVEKVFSIMNNVVNQTQRGHYSYVQVEFNFKTDPFEVISKGMTKDTYGKRLNQNIALDCGDTIPWDNTEVKKFKEAGNTIAIHISENGSVCFSKDGVHFELKGKLNNIKIGRRGAIFAAYLKILPIFIFGIFTETRQYFPAIVLLTYLIFSSFKSNLNN